MPGIYICYKCKSCRHEFVLLVEDVDRMTGFLICPYCSSKRVKAETVADSLKDCMKERSYRRNRHGAMEQGRFDT